MSTAVLLMAHGTPDRPEQMADYLRNVMRGREPGPDLVREFQLRYAKIGGRSPLTDITRAQAEGLERRLGMPVRFGMRTWKPYLAEVGEELRRQGISRVVALPLAPHNSKFSVGRYHEAFQPEGMEVIRVRSWGEEPALIEYWSRAIRERLDDLGTTVLFTAHSVPESPGDPYEEEVFRTAKAIAQRLGDVEWDFAYQSHGMTHDRWLEPDIGDWLKRFSGYRVLVAPIGFVSDHVETLYDLDVVAAEAARALRIPFRRVPMPNASPLLIEGLANVVRRAVE